MTSDGEVAPSAAAAGVTVFVCEGEDFEAWHRAFTTHGVQLVTPDEALAAPDAVTYAAVWAPAPGALAAFPNLAAIFNLGAGVDKLLKDATIPQHVPVVRLRDAGMAAQMSEYALYGALRFHRDFDTYERQQARREWTQCAAVAARDRRVGVLGAGVLGADVATKLAALGFRVRTWSRTPKAALKVTTIDHAAASKVDNPVESHSGPDLAGDAFDKFLEDVDILVNVLPLTPATTGFLDRALFAKLAKGAALVNLARGAHVVPDDLIAALDEGQLRGALLDVFDPHEPLPEDHPLWTHPGVRVTPHVAAQTIPAEAAAQVVDAMRTLEAHAAASSLGGGGGNPCLLLDVVDRSAGY